MAFGKLRVVPAEQTSAPFLDPMLSRQLRQPMIGTGGANQFPIAIDERGAMPPGGRYIEAGGAPAGFWGGPSERMGPAVDDVSIPRLAASQGLLAPHMAQPAAPPPSMLQNALQAAQGPQPVAPDSARNQAMALNVGTPQVKKPGFFGKGGLGWDILGTALDIGSGLGGGEGMYWKTKVARRDRDQDNARKDAALRIQQEREDRVARRPILQNIPNVGLVAVNPDNLLTQTVTPYRSAGQAYVEDGLGLTRDNPEYHRALADFTLKSFGPTALQARADLQDDRQEGQEDMARARYGYQTGLVDHREALTRSRPSKARGGSRSGGGGAPKSPSAVIAPLLLKMSRGVPLTAAEKATLDYQRAGRGGGGGRSTGGAPAPAASTQTRRNPATGDVVRLVNGKWVSGK